MVCKILRLFVDTLTAYDKSSVLNKEYLTHLIHMQLYPKKKITEFFSPFLKSGLNFQQFPKEMITLIAKVFSKLRVSKNVVR